MEPLVAVANDVETARKQPLREVGAIQEGCDEHEDDAGCMVVGGGQSGICLGTPQEAVDDRHDSKYERPPEEA